MNPNIDTEIDEILYKVGSDINKVYTSDPLSGWCAHHYFKLADGQCVGCEAKARIQALIDRAKLEERMSMRNMIGTTGGEIRFGSPKYGENTVRIKLHKINDKRIAQLEKQSKGVEG